ncbi:MAG: HAD family hydrolase [Acidobacteria bacterium]|nr:HAD family hydrolase [Acidobacteriota bacterium]
MAAARLRELWHAEPGSATAAFVVSRFEELRDRLQLVDFRLAVLRSFTVEPLVPLLRAEAFCAGINLSLHLGDFNAYAQEILDSESELYRFRPNAAVLAVQAADIAPDLWRDYADLDQTNVAAGIERVSGSIAQWMREFRRRSQAALIVHSLEQPYLPALGVLDGQREASQAAALERINEEFRRVARQLRGVYVLEYDAMVARHGRARWHDERKTLLARLPIRADQLIHLAREWLRFLAPLAGKSAKALIVDLDNTLWGGVIGEDGFDGIKLSAEYPGAGFQALQRALLDLTRKGILLAICSKNNRADAMEVLEKHPGMLLRPKHFAAMRISWNDKVQGVREIASELNIGVDSLAFLDDNAFEREQVRAMLPEVTVIDLPPDPLDYARVVREQAVFERLSLSEEDQQRAAFYVEQGERARAEQNFHTKEDFYRFLEQEAEIASAQPGTVARISQLTQKTNQFNVTTRRYAEQQIEQIRARPGWQVLSIRVRDRFGDHGLVGVAIVHDHEEVCEIDSFLLSCRVIGRTVETALLSHLAQSARRRGRKRLTGWFLPTKKNAPARNFYPQHGFELAKQNGEGSLWSLDLTRQEVTFPAWVKVTYKTEEELDIERV